MGPGTSAEAAIPIDDGADDKDDNDDDGIEILIDEGDDDDNNDGTGVVANIDAQGNVKVGTSQSTSVAGSSGFAPFILMDLDGSAVTDIKGRNCRKHLNSLQRNYYNKDLMWVKHLHLQLP